MNQIKHKEITPSKKEKHKEISLNKRQQIHKTYLIDLIKNQSKKYIPTGLQVEKWKPK